MHPLFIVMMGISVLIGQFVELVVLFGIVIIHELGHAAAAKLFGWKVVEIQLFPFGGVAVVEEADTATAAQEVIVALAGPLQNLLMILIAYVLGLLEIWESSWTTYFINANAIIALFNLIPILPLDGGRIAQAWLSKQMSYYYTLVISTWLSLILSGVLLMYCLFQLPDQGIHLNLFAIAGFLLFSNGYSLRDLHYRFIRFLMRRQKISNLLVQNGCLLQPIVTGKMYRAISLAKLLKRESYHFIYVLDEDGTIRRVIAEQRLIQELFSSEHNVINYKEMSVSAGVEQ